jgi:rod shape-determining protein MreC
MRYWRRHLLTVILLLVAMLIIGPLGLGDWLWSQPKHLSEGLMIRQAELGSDAIDKQLLSLNEQVIILNKEVADLRSRLLAVHQAKEFEEQGIMEVVVYDARVTSRTRGQREQYVEINRGALDGVKVGMAVCAGRSLLGLVAGEKRHSSLVRLISDPQSKIAAHIYDGKTRLAGGILTGAELSGLCAMLYIEDRPGLDIKTDQHIISAGTDGIIPEGLILGVITAAAPSGDSDNWNITVQPLQPVHAVTEVIVCRRPSVGEEARH